MGTLRLHGQLFTGSAGWIPEPAGCPPWLSPAHLCPSFLAGSQPLCLPSLLPVTEGGAYWRASRDGKWPFLWDYDTDPSRSVGPVGIVLFGEAFSLCSLEPHVVLIEPVNARASRGG